MQTLIDIPEEDLTRLDKLSEDRQVPRDELVRTSVSVYLKANVPIEAPLQTKMIEAEYKAVIDKAFGSWAHRGEDGLAYQDRMRSEW